MKKSKSSLKNKSGLKNNGALENNAVCSHTAYGLKDFNLTHVFECGQCFRNRKLAENEYLVAASDRIVTMRIQRPEESGRCESAETHVNLEISPCTAEEFEGFWKKYLDLDRDYGAIKKRLCKDDEVMREAVHYGYGIRILGQDLWETIISFIISQNNNIPRIKGCIERLCELAGKRLDSKLPHIDFEGGTDLRPYAFPTAEEIAGLTLRDLSGVRLGYRAKYILSVSQAIMENGLPESEEELLKLMGVGPKVANCILLFGMAKYKSFPIDVWVKKVMHELYGLRQGDMQEMKSFAAEHFGNLGGFAQQYLFFYMRDKESTAPQGK